MTRSTTFVIALALGASSLGAQTTNPQLSTGAARQPATMARPQVGGKITWKGNLALTPGAGDACTHFKVKVFEPTPGGSSGGGVNVGPGGKDLGLSSQGSGNIRSSSCSYSVFGVPAGKPVYVSVTYDGAMGSAADTKLGATAPFSVEEKKTSAQNVQVVFTQIK